LNQQIPALSGAQKAGRTEKTSESGPKLIEQKQAALSNSKRKRRPRRKRTAKLKKQLAAAKGNE
jgi:hypothetical protein